MYGNERLQLTWTNGDSWKLRGLGGMDSGVQGAIMSYMNHFWTRYCWYRKMEYCNDQSLVSERRTVIKLKSLPSECQMGDGWMDGWNVRDATTGNLSLKWQGLKLGCRAIRISIIFLLIQFQTALYFRGSVDWSWMRCGNTVDLRVSHNRYYHEHYALVEIFSGRGALRARCTSRNRVMERV
jgi:hypothetical protein